jgi:predicted HicB family RNase H-like nuclease
MMNIMDINGYKANIVYDPEIEMFRGEFVGVDCHNKRIKESMKLSE